jgi:hypothetical protein
VWRILAPAILLLSAASPGLAQGSQLTAYSDASYPQEWRLLHDYWFNTTSFLNDTRTFHVRIAVPAAGTYVWTMPDHGGIRPDLPNPLSRMFSVFRVTLDGESWDLAAKNTTTPFAADGASDLHFTFSYRIANLSPYEYTTILEETQRVRDAERAQWPDANIVSRPNEASGFIRLQQVSSDQKPPDCPSGACADITYLAARDFNLVFNLIGKAFQLTFHQATHIPVERASDGLWAAGSSYTSNAAFDATIQAVGNLTKHPVAVRLDARDGALVATLRPGQSRVAVTLPSGTHQFHYAFDPESPGGAIAIHAPRSSAGLLDAIRIPPDGHRDLPLLWLALALAALAFLAFAAHRRRFTWYEYQRDRLYLVVDRLGHKPNREHRGRPPPLARVRQPGGR